MSEALGKTTRLSLSDSYSQDGQGMLKQSISRKNEERPLMTPDEVRRLNPDKIILIPERQNPILVDRIDYYEDARFKSIAAAQKGPMPYPDPVRAELDALRAEVMALKEERLAYPPAEASVPGRAEAEPGWPAMLRRMMEAQARLRRTTWRQPDRSWTG